MRLSGVCWLAIAEKASAGSSLPPIGRQAYFPASKVLYSPAPDSTHRETIALAEARATPRMSAAVRLWVEA